ncbi:DUF4209 domain-containing protein [Phaeobacter inhibens]|uniref:DUF4209 domain-containing protein n=1 Tax=Phaeobacter inhibens TaxID=221822 RepID=UPI0018DB20BA|nr:DUF4209 domain-containing protein [Phaeobacter inhibens]
MTKFDDATGTQEDRTISALYDTLGDELKAIFGTALIDDIRRVFLSKHGPNLRNGVAHALHHDGAAYGPDAIYASWLVWHICCLPLAKHWNELFPSS